MKHGISSSGQRSSVCPAAKRRRLLLCDHTRASLELVKNRLGKVARRRATTHIRRPDLALLNDLVHRPRDRVGLRVQTQVTQHHRSAEKHCRRVGLVLRRNVLCNVTASRLVEGKVAADVGTGHYTGSTNEGCADVGDNVAVQVGHDHDVELARLAYELHRRVVDDHVARGDAGALVLLGDVTEGVEEETVTELHDVGLVYAHDALAVVLEGKVEGKAGDALGAGASRDLERLDYAGDRGVLETRVLSLGVLTDNDDVDVLVAGGEAGERLAEGQGGVDVEALAEGDVPAWAKRSAASTSADDLAERICCATVLTVVGRGVNRRVH